ncbi:transcription initiation factor TFIID subunit A-domain-containing protein [Russula aff. rugulosa BPL654]|nr:transcription initiation factor TFIID subunit A-domain-containing protein [Russula aff. rugulosa BPL654]
MRRSIQDLALSMDPNIKIEPEVEDLLLDIADEFIDSVTNFGCRLAKHRGGDTLEVRDLQLHLGAWLAPPLFQESWPYVPPTQNAITTFAFLVSHQT